eukprot:scaffold85500_cov58-Phaeocystis_antarctica.AAC.2
MYSTHIREPRVITDATLRGAPLMGAPPKGERGERMGAGRRAPIGGGAVGEAGVGWGEAVGAGAAVGAVGAVVSVVVASGIGALLGGFVLVRKVGGMGKAAADIPVECIFKRESLGAR